MSTSQYFVVKESTDSKRGSQQPSAKRAHSEVSNTSAEELSLILAELDEIKTELKSVVKTEDLKETVRTLVVELIRDAKDEMNEKVVEIERKSKEKIDNLQNKIESLEIENHQLKERFAKCDKSLREMSKSVKEAMYNAKESQRKSNYNEQYSRKNNIKIHGLQEVNGEDTGAVATKFLMDMTKVEVKDAEIIAVHRIPGRKGVPRPILLKLKNSDVKARVMKKRSVVKNSGKRLSDDVTKPNSLLIQRLNDNEGIDQAWYYNGRVYGRSKVTGTRLQFDLFDDIEQKLRKG